MARGLGEKRGGGRHRDRGKKRRKGACRPKEKRDFVFQKGQESLGDDAQRKGHRKEDEGGERVGLSRVKWKDPQLSGGNKRVSMGKRGDEGEQVFCSERDAKLRPRNHISQGNLLRPPPGDPDRKRR